MLQRRIHHLMMINRRPLVNFSPTLALDEPKSGQTALENTLQKIIVIIKHFLTRSLALPRATSRTQGIWFLVACFVSRSFFIPIFQKPNDYDWSLFALPSLPQPRTQRDPRSGFPKQCLCYQFLKQIDRITPGEDKIPTHCQIKKKNPRMS